MSVNKYDAKTDKLVPIAGGSSGAPEVYIGTEEPEDKTKIWVNPEGKGKEATASGVSYDNSKSGLDADNLQEAVDEIRKHFADFKFGALTRANIDDNINSTNSGTLIRSGFFDERAHLSFTVGFITLQIRYGEAVYMRTKYGNSAWTEWKAIYTS